MGTDTLLAVHWGINLQRVTPSFLEQSVDTRIFIKEFGVHQMASLDDLATVRPSLDTDTYNDGSANSTTRARISLLRAFP